MKAERKTESAFVPVILTLESQAEVDGVYALLVHAPCANAVGLPDAWRALEPHRDPVGYYVKFNPLDALFRKNVIP